MFNTYRIVRYIMMAFNTTFLLCGIGVLVAGIVIRADRKERFLYLEVCDKFEYHSVAYLTIASGLLIISISAIGIYGTLKESRSVLLTFIFCLFTLFLIKVAVGILTVVYKNELENEVKNCMNSTLLNYFTDAKLRSSWDTMQEKWFCCGVLQAKDYEYATKRPFNFTAPQSCGSNTEQGCHPKLKVRARNALDVLAAVAGLVTLIELFGICIALWIVCKISEKYHSG